MPWPPVASSTRGEAPAHLQERFRSVSWAAPVVYRAPGVCSNATVIPSGAPLGFLTLWPNSEGQPLVSTLNAVVAPITLNMAIVPTLNCLINAFAPSPTLPLDIFSYFAPTAPLNTSTTSLPSATLSYNYMATLGAGGGVCSLRLEHHFRQPACGVGS